jgi:hypothetical protein
MVGAIRAPATTSIGRSPSEPRPVALWVATGFLLGAALTASLGNLSVLQPAERAPADTPTDVCWYTTLQPESSVVPTMVSRCDYMFDERQLVQVGYRL